MYGYHYNKQKQIEINLGALLCVGFNKKYQKIDLVSIKDYQDKIRVNFKRRLDNEDVVKFNEKYGLDDNNKLEYINYILDLSKLNHNINFYLDFDKYYGISTLNENEINVLLVEHLNEVHNNLLPYMNLLITTLLEKDEELYYWTYYWGQYGYSMGMANKNTNFNNTKCLSLDNYVINNNPLEYNEDKLYYDCYKVYGTENDAKCVQVRRNFNSNKYANWKYCKVGTPIRELQ